MLLKIALGTLALLLVPAAIVALLMYLAMSDGRDAGGHCRPHMPCYSGLPAVLNSAA